MSRHVLILFLLLSGSVIPARGQEVRVGLSGGVSRASFGGDVEGLDHRTGHALGPTLGYGVSDRIQVETGAMWIEKGATGTGLARDRVEPLLAAHVLDYLEIPLLFRTSVPTGRLRARLNLGAPAKLERHVFGELSSPGRGTGDGLVGRVRGRGRLGRGGGRCCSWKEGTTRGSRTSKTAARPSKLRAECSP